MAWYGIGVAATPLYQRLFVLSLLFDPWGGLELFLTANCDSVGLALHLEGMG